MDGHTSEEVAQLLHEKTRLLNDFNHLQINCFSLEENYNVVCKSLLEKNNEIKSLEEQLTRTRQTLLERELQIESLEQNKERINKENEKLMSEQCLLKEKLRQEKMKSDQAESLKVIVEELKNTCKKTEEENSRLLSELSIKIEEHSLHASEVNDLQHQIKELEEEIKTMGDSLIFREPIESTGSSDNMECFWRNDLDSRSRISETSHFVTNGSRLFKEENSVNLLVEMLEAQVQEKQSRIEDLECLLCKREEEKEEEEAGRNKLIGEIKESLWRTGLLNYNSINEFSRLLRYTVRTSLLIIWRFLWGVLFLLLGLFLLFSLFIWVFKIEVWDLTDNEVDNLLKNFGLLFQVRYPKGPPPI